MISAKREQHFFQALNPAAMPPEYSAAFDKKDYSSALKTAIDYFRKRPTPPLLSDINMRTYDMTTAENAAKGNITVINIPHQFADNTVDFQYDPTRETGVFNPEWQWQINRMYFWKDMALAYHHTHNEKFAAAFAGQIESWVTNVHCPQEWNAIGSAWRTIETGLRLMGSWQTAFEIFRHSPSVSDETLALMLGSIHEQTLHAFEHRTRGNWLMMEINGVYTFAMLFPEFKISAKMQKEAAFILGEELKKQILPDGMQNELSPDYHTVVFNCASMMFKIAKQQQGLSDLPPDFAKNLERMADAYIKMTTPGLTQPRTNDCFTMKLSSLMAKAYEFFPHRKDFLWGATERKEGTPPAGESASYFMPYAGFAVMRSSWEEDAAYLCFDVGSLGVAHAHQDKLNINIYKGGEELIFDDGGGQYEVSPFRSYGVSGYGHNTVLTDGEAQNRTAPGLVEKEIDAEFFTDEKFDYACGIYDDTFGEKMQKTATHKREVLFVKPDFFVVADTLQSADGKPHEYTMLLQMDTVDVQTSNNSFCGIFNGQYDLYALQLSENTTIKVESGQTDPVSGWYIGRNDKNQHRSSTVKITSKREKDFRFLTIFFPLKKGTALPVIKQTGDLTMEIFFNGKTYKLNLTELKSNTTSRS